MINFITPIPNDLQSSESFMERSGCCFVESMTHQWIIRCKTKKNNIESIYNKLIWDNF